MIHSSWFQRLSVLVFVFVLGKPLCAQNQPSIETQIISQSVLASGASRAGTIRVKHSSGTTEAFQLKWSLRLNSSFADIEVPDLIYGVDHAAKIATSQVSIDGKDFGDARVTDGDDFTSFESPWTAGYQTALLDLDLQQVRSIKALRWLAADANWIWNVDVSCSTDGQDYIEVPELQKFDMHQKWLAHSFPLKQPFQARYLRFRFYKPDGTMNMIRLPKTIEVFDGMENDRVQPPQAGDELASGSFDLTLEADQATEVDLELSSPLTSGAYLLDWSLESKGSTHSNWAHLFVTSDTEVDKNLTRRFGINASNIQLAEKMSECGFGWVRFENGKWNMSSTAQDTYAYDGTVAPWHVNQDEIYETYHSLNMRVLPYVFQTPEWANSAGPEITVNRAGYPPKNPADYGEAIFQMVARYGSRKHDPNTLKTSDKKSGVQRIHAIELWNEPNLVGPTWAPFVGSIKEYFDVMRAGVDGARRADPTLVVTSCGWAGVELATLKQMTDHRYSDGKCPLDLVDVINVHFYSGVQEPETALEDPNTRKEKTSATEMNYLDQLDDLIKWRDAHNPDAEIWMTETGNDVGGPIGLSERKQAAKIPRVTMITLARGIDKVFIYRESGSQPTMHAGAGLLRDDGTLRPSWFTMATMIRQLQGFDGKADRWGHSNPNVWILCWKSNERQVVAAWTLGEPTTLRFSELPSEFRVRRIVDAFGHTRKVDETIDAIELSEFPVYLTAE